MAMNGLTTACEEHIPITVVIFDNGILGWVRNAQGDRPIASEFSNMNYANIAQSLGRRGCRIGKPGELEKVIKQATESDVTTVLDVATSTKFTYRDVSSQF